MGRRGRNRINSLNTVLIRGNRKGEAFPYWSVSVRNHDTEESAVSLSGWTMRRLFLRGGSCFHGSFDLFRYVSTG